MKDIIPKNILDKLNDYDEDVAKLIVRTGYEIADSKY